ncbi:hypothetical protein KR018_004514, partial [Drosophila ironensis]
IVKKHSELFSEPDEKLTYTTVVQGQIRTNTESPAYSRHYPYPASLRPEVEKQINQLLDDGIIRPSRSPYNAPVWIVPKKTDASGEKKYRLVIDYRKLNAITISDRYPIPEIGEIIAQLGRNKYFTVLDLKGGFHQIPLNPRDIEKTAFSVNEEGTADLNRSCVILGRKSRHIIQFLNKETLLGRIRDVVKQDVVNAIHCELPVLVFIQISLVDEFPATSFRHT